MSGMTPVEFLLARIAEREATANEVASLMREAVESGRYKDLPSTDPEVRMGPRLEEQYDGFPLLAVSPAVVLAECAAIRQIVELHAVDCYVGSGPDGDDEYFCDGCRADTAFHPCDVRCPTLVALAAVHADHPDYREEWRP